MIFYWIIFIALAFWGIKGQKNYFYLSFVLLLILGATRARTVGADLRGDYWVEYVTMGTTPNTWGLIMHQFEYGFLWLMAKFKQYIDYNDNPLMFFHVLFAVTFINYGIYIRRMSCSPTLSLFFMYAFAYYFSTYNAMRQELCVSSIFLCFMLFMQKDKPQYKLLIGSIILLSFLFHKSMLALLAVIPIFLYYNKISDKYLYIALIFSSVFSLTLANFAIQQMSQYASFFDDGSSNISSYMRDNNNLGRYSNLSNILNTLFCIYCVYCSRYRRNFYLVLYVFGVVLLNVLTPINWVFQRLAFVFMFFRVFVYTDLWYNMPNKQERYLFRIVVMLLAIIMFQNRLINDNYQDVVPYVNEYITLK